MVDMSFWLAHLACLLLVWYRFDPLKLGLDHMVELALDFGFEYLVFDWSLELAVVCYCSPLQCFKMNLSLCILFYIIKN